MIAERANAEKPNMGLATWKKAPDGKIVKTDVVIAKNYLIEKLDAFLKFNDYEVLTDAGKVSSEVAKTLALKEFEKFRVVQDQIFESDFDKEIKKITNS